MPAYDRNGRCADEERLGDAYDRGASTERRIEMSPKAWLVERVEPDVTVDQYGFQGTRQLREDAEEGRQLAPVELTTSGGNVSAEQMRKWLAP